MLQEPLAIVQQHAGILETGGGLLIGEDYEYCGNKIWDLKVNTKHIK
jgi:hypothetical protein